MNLFEKNLSADGTEVLNMRSKILGEDYKAAAEKELTKLNDQMRELKRKEVGLTDFSRTSRDSLVVGENALPPANWVSEMARIDIEKEALQLQIDAVKKIISKYFTDLEETTEE